MLATQSQSIFDASRIEDVLLLITPFVTAVVGSNLLGLIPGTSGFLLGVVIAALAKALAGLGQDKNSLEDILLFTFTLLGAIGAGLTSNPTYAVAGLVIGAIAKAIPSLYQGFNWEDAILFVGALLAGLGTAFGSAPLTSIGLLLAVVGKSVPSLASSLPALVTPVASTAPKA